MSTYPFYGRENRGSEKKGDMPKAPQLVCGRAGSQRSLPVVDEVGGWAVPAGSTQGRHRTWGSGGCGFRQA